MINRPTARGAVPRRARCEPLESRRLLSAGDLDPSFSDDGKTTFPLGAGATIEATDLAVQADGKVVVVGYNNTGDFAVARFNADGTPDTGFGPTGSGILFTSNVEGGETTGASAVAVQADGRIVVAGVALLTVGGSHLRFCVTRYLSDGTPDASFDGNGSQVTGFDETRDLAYAYDVAIQNDGKIVVGGTASKGDDYDFAVVRYNVDGSLDSTFDGDGKITFGFGGDDIADALAIDYSGNSLTNPNYGKIVLVGYQDGNPSRFAFARLRTNGTLDSGFDGDGKLTMPFAPGYGYSVATGVVAQGGGYVVCGQVGASPSATDFGVMRLYPDGTRDFNFGPSNGRLEIDFGAANDAAQDIIIGQTGKLLVGGSSGGQGALACLDSDGILDPLFSGDGLVTTSFTGLSASAKGLARSPGGMLVAAGGDSFAAARYYDRRPVVSIASYDPEASEAGQEIAGLIVARMEPLPTPRRVYIDVSGTARAPYLLNADYTVNGMTIVHPITGRSYVDIAGGSTFTTVVVNPANDLFYEGDETIMFSISADQDYFIGTPASITLAIRDDDGAAPIVSSSQFLYDSGPPHRLRFTFDQDVASSISADDFAVMGPSGPVPFSLSYDSIINTATLSFDGILPDGNYHARAIAAGLSNSQGTPMSWDSLLNFFFLSGDADHDRDVDINDLGVLASNWQQSPRTFSQGDFDYSGTVDVNDLGILASHWQQALLGASAPGPSSGKRMAKRIAAEVL
jgi:uncharacterized delta-60 repeat protein